MRKNVFRKSLLIGIISLFLGASIFPIVNAKQMQNIKLNLFILSHYVTIQTVKFKYKFQKFRLKIEKIFFSP